MICLLFREQNDPKCSLSALHQVMRTGFDGSGIPAKGMPES